MSNYYSKTGDNGETSLANGKRIKKNDPRIEAYGTIDELNSWIGLIKSELKAKEEKVELTKIQQNLMKISSILAEVKNNKPFITEKEIEKFIARHEAGLPKLKGFVIPGGNKIASMCHVARTICRRAERNTVSLINKHSIDQEILNYLNRLSSYFFVLALDINRKTKNKEEYLN